MFTRNASEAVNLVAHAWGTANLKPGDEVRHACWHRTSQHRFSPSPFIHGLRLAMLKPSSHTRLQELKMS